MYQCWYINTWTLKNRILLSLNKNITIFIEEYQLNHVICKMVATLPSPECGEKMRLDLLSLMRGPFCLHLQVFIKESILYLTET